MLVFCFDKISHLMYLDKLDTRRKICIHEKGNGGLGACRHPGAGLSGVGFSVGKIIFDVAPFIVL